MQLSSNTRSDTEHALTGEKNIIIIKKSLKWEKEPGHNGRRPIEIRSIHYRFHFRFIEYFNQCLQIGKSRGLLKLEIPEYIDFNCPYFPEYEKAIFGVMANYRDGS
ncbi:hypothetical protein AVEN_54053-1 [Araneus ventricosus]|uniref:Uncharacterized protein n=1 Tax=Araneus ventricosus TaxID=182803 RepID=A0A4Y2U397_ARAVE|nr:hypothetical protein AVEN_54053-1 [Araneus ventricosus]